MMRFLPFFLIVLFPVAGLAAPSMDEYDNVPPGILLPETAVENPSSPEGAPEKADRPLTTEEVIAAYRRGDYALAAKHLQPLAKNGYHPAEELLGIMYHNGQGVEKDPAQALFWLTRAAEAKFPLAHYHLANMAFSGEGMPEDPVKALMWLHIALSYYQESPEKTQARKDRQNLLSRLSRRDKERAKLLALAWLEKRGDERRFSAE